MKGDGLILTGLPQKLQNQIPGLFKVIFQDCLNFFYKTQNLILAITLSCTYFFVLVIDQKF